VPYVSSDTALINQHAERSGVLAVTLCVAALNASKLGTVASSSLRLVLECYASFSAQKAIT
jgi:hypothetical protein